MKQYTAYRRFSACFDTETQRFVFGFSGYDAGMTFSIVEARYMDEKVFEPGMYRECRTSVQPRFDGQLLRVLYSGGPEAQPELEVTVTLTKDGVACRLGVLGHLKVSVRGEMWMGADGGRPVCLDRRGMDLRAACGPYASNTDNALYDPGQDAALEVCAAAFRMRYDWDRGKFGFTMTIGGDDVERDFEVKLKEHLYARKFGIPFSPINHRTCFPTPPVGWMTWYAVQFDASEDTVLENAKIQREKLAPYGANALWVDWEWYHQDFSGTGKPGTDIFHPDPERYPHGLAYLASQISALGLIPALWIGATNDPNENEFFHENPEVVLMRKRAWCGQYFIDPTHPKVLEEYIPRVFRQIVEAGYKALKWDCLPISFERIDACHDRLCDPTLSTDEAMYNLVRRARETVGDDFYMLSCSGETARDILFAGDLFDAARIGGDIFRWHEFITNAVDRILKLYAFHNTLLYADPDNVVIRPKYNTFDQAVTRVSLVSLLGLPVTFGDDLRFLDAERMALLQHAIPAMDIVPMDIRENPGDHRSLIVNLGVEMPWERWNVVDVVNLLEEPARLKVSLSQDLHLDAHGSEEYLLFDFWGRRFMGIATDAFDVALGACASKVIAIRRKTGAPQLLGTTRHPSQGALELDDVHYDSQRRILSGIADVVEGDDYALYIYAPEGMRAFVEGNDTSVLDVTRVDSDDTMEYEMRCPSGSVWRVALPTGQGGKVAWSVAFTECHPA